MHPVRPPSNPQVYPHSHSQVCLHSYPQVCPQFYPQVCLTLIHRCALTLIHTVRPHSLCAAQVCEIMLVVKHNGALDKTSMGVTT